jgi:hypothetical protein
MSSRRPSPPVADTASSTTAAGAMATNSATPQDAPHTTVTGQTPADNLPTQVASSSPAAGADPTHSASSQYAPRTTSADTTSINNTSTADVSVTATTAEAAPPVREPAIATRPNSSNKHSSHVEYPALPKMPPDISKTASRHASSADGSGNHPTAKAESTNGSEGGNTSSIPLADDGRPKLDAKRRHGRAHAPDDPYTPPDLASKIVYEEFSDPEDPKPKGYLGTVAGARIIASTVEDYCACGTGGGHYLVCGHTIVSETSDVTCGSNCKTGLHVAQPFNCPACRAVVNDVLENKLTPAEQENVKFHQSRDDTLAITLSIEYVSKYMPTARGNISHTLLSIAMPKYGRACQMVPDEEAPTTLAELYQEHREAMEQNSRARHFEIKSGPLNVHEKRKATTSDPQTPFSANLGVPTPPITPESPTVNTVAEDHNKKQKTKLETHTEPITEQTRGIKRDAVKEDQSHAEDPLPAPSSNKKLKTKLDSHPQPITPLTPGTKRKLGATPVFANTFRRSKRISHHGLEDLGDATFHPIPPALGELERKRAQDAKADYSSKRRRSSDVLPGSHAETTWSPIDPKKRMSLPEYVAMNGGNDEL